MKKPADSTRDIIHRTRDRLIADRADVYKRLSAVNSNIALLDRLIKPPKSHKKKKGGSPSGPKKARP